MNPDDRKYRRVAIVAFLAHLFVALGDAFAIWQTYYQLVSPLIDKKLIAQINQPYIVALCCMGVLTVVLLILFFYKKYIAVLFLGAASIVLNIALIQLLPYL